MTAAALRLTGAPVAPLTWGWFAIVLVAACAQSAGDTAPLDPFFQDEHGIPLGSEVTIAAETFGQETTAGTLVAATRTRFTLKRVDERAGTVHVHFPRIGYVLKAAQA